MNKAITLKVLAPLILLAILAVAVAQPAFAQSGPGGASSFSQHADDHLQGEMSGLLKFMLNVVIIAAVFVAIASVWMAWQLIKPEGNQRVQEVGWKGPGVGFLVAGILVSIPWFVGTGASTVTGNGFDSDSWDRLQEGGSSSRYEQMFEGVAPTLASNQLLLTFQEVGHS